MNKDSMQSPLPAVLREPERFPELWQSLAEEPRDILLYGMGNGADKILAVLAARGIPVAGVFASDGFARGQSFHGMRVRSYSEIRESYPPGGCVILLAFGSARPEVLAAFDEVAARYPLLVPDVPVCGEVLFDAALLAAHREELLAARALLSDAESCHIFDTVLAARLTGRYALLREAVSPDDTAELLALREVRHAADLGAYTGDSANALLRVAPLSLLLCAEPDRHSFTRLTKWASGIPDVEIECHRVAVLGENGAVSFSASGNRGAGISVSGGEQVPAATPDSLISERWMDYLKYDVEGAEEAALYGSRRTIARCQPRLRVACYHRSEDLYRLPLLLHELAPRHRLYLRRADGVPAWDIDLLAVPEPEGSGGAPQVPAAHT